jgi:hypothetical protein
MEETPFLGHEDRILPYVYTPELIAELEKHAAAAEAAADTERAKMHVGVDRLILEHLKRYLAMHAAEWQGDFAAAAVEADAMMLVRRALMAISPFFVLDNEERYNAGIFYWGVVERADYYRKLAAMTGGSAGTRVALLPEKALFQVDPLDDGRFEEWFDPAYATDDWVRVSTTKPFYAQGYSSPEGHPYVGPMWYRFDVEVPADAAGKPVRLYCPAVETEAWVWVNGQYIGHRRYRESYERPNELDLEITAALKPGQANTIVIRVTTGSSRAAVAGGLVSRLFLYSPNGAAAGQ